MPNYKAKIVHRTSFTETRRLEWASDAQRQAFQYGPYPLLLSGGYGSGKTFAGCFKALFLSDIFPRNRGLIARKVWEDLKKTTMATFFKVCPEDAYINGRRADQEKYLRLNNGSEILWAHLDSPETENMIQGIEINWFLIDQAEEVHEEIFEKLMARLGRWDQTVVPQGVIDRFEARYRTSWPWLSPSGKPIPPVFPMGTCNPDHKLHWLYRRFHEESPEHWDKTMRDPRAPNSHRRYSYHDFGYRMITMRSIDNKHLPDQNIEQLLSRDQSFIDRYVMGKWGLPEGTIHKINTLSILEPTSEVLNYVFSVCSNYGLGYDHGDTAPSCALWSAYDSEGNVFVYREYYRGGLTITQHRKNIRDYGKPDRDLDHLYSFKTADPAIFNKTMQKLGGRHSASDEYEDTSYDSDTAIIFEAGDNDELGTRNRINELLKVDPDHKNPITGESGAPRLYFVCRGLEYPHGCHKVIQETQAQRRVKLGMHLGKPLFSDERDDSIDDHSYDALRYTIARRLKGYKEITRRKITGTFKGAELLLDRVNRQTRGMTRRQAREARRYGRI